MRVADLRKHAQTGRVLRTIHLQKRASVGETVRSVAQAVRHPIKTTALAALKGTGRLGVTAAMHPFMTATGVLGGAAALGKGVSVYHQMNPALLRAHVGME